MRPTETPRHRIEQLVLEYAQEVPELPLDSSLSLREQLGIESLALVALIVRLGDEFDIDFEERGLDLARLERVADLVALVTDSNPKANVETRTQSTSMSST